MTTFVVVFLSGLALSGFFSGCETGLYRVSRIRILLDGRTRSWLARWMIWLLNHPDLFVATSLVGNNIANYLTSWAIVVGVHRLMSETPGAELLGTLLLAPLVFLLGELLPKSLFMMIPYRLISVCRLPLLLFSILFAPVSLVLGILARGLRIFTGQGPFQDRLLMARSELELVFREGQESGLLAGSQRRLAQNIFSIGNQPAVRAAVPLHRWEIIPSPASCLAAKAAARKQGHPLVLVGDRDRLVGALAYADLMHADDRGSAALQPIVFSSTTEKHLSVLLRLYESNAEVAVLVDPVGKKRWVVTRRQLTQPLLADFPVTMVTQLPDNR